MSKPDYTDEFERLHAEYLQAVLAYHNAYIKFTGLRQSRDSARAMQQAQRQLAKLSKLMIKEITNLKKAKKEKYKDLYQGQRARNGFERIETEIHTTTKKEQHE
jgi:hypothetical protein